MTKLEEAARALCGHLTGVPWDELPETRQAAKAAYRAGEIDANTPYKNELLDNVRAVIETLWEPGNYEWNAKLDAILSEGDSKADRCPHGVPVSETCTMCRVDAGEIGFA